MRRLVIALLLLVATVALASPAAAASTCVRTGDVLNLNLEGSNTPFEQFAIDRTLAGDINARRSALLSSTAIDCGDATTTNVNTININGTSAVETIGISFEDGGFAPGQTSEGTPQESEIEIHVDLGGGNGSGVVVGTPGVDSFVMGAKGVNVNDDGDGDDIEFAPSVEMPAMSGTDGDDRLDATGGSGTGGPSISPVVLVGSDDEDVLRGGSASDYLTGGNGRDRLSGGSGNDRLGADASPLTFPAMTEAGPDLIRGGPGGDVLRGGLDEDRLDGGPGDDEEHGNDGDDVFTQGKRSNGADHLFGGDGQDEVRYRARRARVEVTLDNKRNDGASGERDAVGVKLDVENVSGGRGDDALKGSKRANTLEGNAGPDLLVGKAGTDDCRGGPGADVLRSCE